MNIVQNKELRDQVYDNIRARIVKERNGIHLSDLILCLRKAYFRKKGLAPSPKDDQVILWLTGFAFQEYMFPLGQEVPLICDGIVCTPDIESGIEVKTTRQSMGRFDPYEMAHWHRQILGYCKALDKLEYDLVVMFVCGNYKPPFPDLDCWHISVSQDKVDSNWEEVVYNRDRLVRALEIGVPPEPNPEPWEASYCECLDLCTDTACYRKMELKRRLK